MNKTETAKKTAKTIIHTLITGTHFILKTTAQEINNLTNNTKCPKCGQTKKPQYPTCYKCHKKRR